MKVRVADEEIEAAERVFREENKKLQATYDKLRQEKEAKIEMASGPRRWSIARRTFL